MDYVAAIVVFIAIYAILAASLNVMIGHAGLLSLCHAGFYGIGAYASALAAARLGWPVGLAMAGATVLAGVVGALLALALLRLKGDFFILGSLAFQIIIIDVVRNTDDLTGGPHGIAGIPRPAPFGTALTAAPDYALLYGAVALAEVLLLHAVTTSAFGRTLNAVRDDEVAATAIGRNVTWFRVRAFAIAAAGAGLAGALYAHYVTFIDPSSFGFAESVYLLSMVVIGGMATTAGPLLGAAVLVIAPELLRFVGLSSGVDANVRQLLYGALLIAFAFLRPRGIAGRQVL